MLEENQALLEETLLKAEESDRLKTAFLANLSHEIRTPMNGILGFADLLKDEELTFEQQSNYINVIKSSGNRLLKIIYDLVDISKIESNQMQMYTEQCNLVEIIDELIEFFYLETKEKGIALRKKTDIPANESKIMCDATKITQVISNLITNAIKYTETGSITIGCTKNNNDFVVYVKDTGRGIPKDKMEIIFDRFRQLEDEELQFAEGSGLGLSIAKAFVELHGGKIWLESTIKKGTTFYFSLPVLKVPAEEALSPLYESNEIKPASVFDNKKVLIVEDDKFSYLLLHEILRNYGLNVIYAKDGKEAVDFIVHNTSPDLILMDVKTPRLNGLKAAKEIKHLNKSIPIVLQTAYFEMAQRKAQQNKYVDGCIAKPIKKEELLSVLIEHL